MQRKKIEALVHKEAALKVKVVTLRAELKTTVDCCSLKLQKAEVKVDGFKRKSVQDDCELRKLHDSLSNQERLQQRSKAHKLEMANMRTKVQMR